MFFSKDELRKLFYKARINAHFAKAQDGALYYTARVETDSTAETVIFHIPFEDMGTASFTAVMEAKYLARWIQVDDISRQPTT